MGFSRFNDKYGVSINKSMLASKGVGIEPGIVALVIVGESYEETNLQVSSMTTTGAWRLFLGDM